MNLPTILVVDDDDRFQNEVNTAMAEQREVRLLQAQNLTDALDLIRSHHLTVAFVDMYLPRDPVPGADGLRVIRELKDLRPTCTIVFMTEAPDDALLEAYRLLSPLSNRRIDSLLSKGAPTPASAVIREVAEKLRRSRLQIGNLDLVCASLGNRLDRWQRWHDEHSQGHGGSATWAKLTDSEVASLISQILKENSPVTIDGDEIDNIQLIEQGGGKSSSVVFKGKPVTRSGHQGNLCIFKLGPLAEIRAEFQNYDRFVRFYRGTYRRVELLGFAAGDTIGVICYSFAGPSPDGAGVTSVQECFERRDIAVLSYLDIQLNPKRKEWYLQEAPSNKFLTQFFEEHYHVDCEKVTRNIRRMISGEHGLLESVGGYIEEVEATSQWIVAGGSNRILLPAVKDFSLINTSIPHFRSCIVHGDLNGGNILVARAPNEAEHQNLSAEFNSDRVITIDYRHTRRGPIFIDFAALECSIRLAEAELSPYRSQGPELKELIDRENDEQSLWHDAWKDENDSNIYREKQVPYWAQVSYGLMKLARGNFEYNRPGYRQRECEREYAATCLMYGLRLLRIRELAAPYTAAAQLRLICWMSQLLRVIRQRGR